ncbi:hypothetical protein A1OW_12240 [Enterovibrio norvegicus]|uniref:hypothetical protein n=1 Tax=Enterovibrio norvegicus TaxID=188144 RepID=UPI00030D4A07|nr:hypothetical protein [Enterovibrio norvegicus]OEF49659.1 hypothetical protein A1OW_12240 [Enterovibrio norvegicus]
MPSRKRLLTLPCFALAGLLVAPVVAKDTVRVSGFGTVSVIDSGTDNLGFKYDLSKEGLYGESSLKPGSALGLQINATITDNIDAVVQGVMQDRIENDIEKSISWAFLRYKFSPNVSFRVGRIATPIYMLSEYRDVGFAYLWTKPITDFYSAIPIASMDGADIAFRYSLGDGILETRFFGGQSNVTIETINDPYEVTLGPLFGTKLTYEVDNWLFSGSATTTKVKEGDPSLSITSNLSALPQSLWPSLPSTLEDFRFVDTRITYYSLGTSYESGDWNVQAELSYTDTDWPFFPDLAAGYTSVGRVLDSLTVFGFLSKAKSVGGYYELTSPPTTSLAIPDIATGFNLIDQNLKARIVNQETLGFGMRYDVNANVALKGQIERTWLIDNRIGGWSTTASGLTASVPDYIDTYSVSLSFVF